jgi:acetyl esterase/lipase
VFPSFRVRQLATAALVGNALHPPSNYWLGAPAMVAGWLTSELAPHLLAVTAAQGVRELTRERKDPAGLALAGLSAAGLAVLIRQSVQSEQVVDLALRKGLGEDYRAHLSPQDSELDLGTPWQQLAFPFLVRNREVETFRDIPYAEGSKHTSLDVFRRRDGGRSGAPVLVHVHGGAWMTGDKQFEGLPILLHMAARGWLCVNVNYRLSPKHPFPAQIVDVKRALAWVREHAAEYGADPSFVAICGGSAGGHLAALAAVTPGEPDFQPGFESADTSLQAAVPHYGIYDFAAASGAERAVRRRDRFLARYVLKKSFAEHATDFESASPALRANQSAPPFFVVHGAHDTGVEVEEARHFVRRLRQVSQQPVAYAELPGTQHAFDFFPSIRSAHVVRGVERFLRWTLARHQAEAIASG